MNTKKQTRTLVLAGVILALVGMACNISGTTTEISPTAPSGGGVNPTQSSGGANPTPAAPVATSTPVPDVPGPGGCTLNGAYAADVTIPDGTEIPPGKPFVKTWRMRNTGTCPWKPGTKLVFVSGEQMNGPASVAVDPVPPDGGARIDVNLTAPNTPGTYKGYWQLQSPDGTAYGSTIWVEIVVPSAPSATQPPASTSVPGPTTGAPQEFHISVPLDEVNSYSSNGYDTVRPGDDPSDSRVIGFMSWDIQAHIPAGAEIVSAEIVWSTQCFRGGDVGDCTGDRRPFRWKTMDRLGNLEIQQYYYGTQSNPPTALLDPSIVQPFQVYQFQPTGTLDVTDRVADDFDSGTPFQLRLAFENDTYDSGIGNGIIFVEGNGPNTLEVVYR